MVVFAALEKAALVSVGTFMDSSKQWKITHRKNSKLRIDAPASSLGHSTNPGRYFPREKKGGWGIFWKNLCGTADS
ncbi:MAG: hypothetical protein PHI97_03840 [Desulfobulbus sp.]|nr:hypothetical protein [Desulfobulbus sp.]